MSQVFEALGTIVIGGTLECGHWALLINLRKFIEDESIVGLCDAKGSGVLTHMSFPNGGRGEVHEFAYVEQEN